MDIFLGLLENVLEEGFIYGIMAIGVYITYTILDFPDLSVDGTFPLGACITAVLITAGVNPWLVLIIAFLCGAAAGCVTGILHVKLKITDLLSGILVMTAMWSVNLLILSGKSALQFFNQPTIFNTGLATLLPEALYKHRVVIIALICVLVVKFLIDWFLKTKSGLLLRAAGDNQLFVTSQAKDPGLVKILGLALGNGCTALAGCVLAQQAESANITSGTGMVVMALASVIIGISIFRRVKFIRPTLMVVFGACIYKACLSIAMQLGLPTTYLKLLMAVIFVIALMANNVKFKGKKGVTANGK